MMSRARKIHVGLLAATAAVTLLVGTSFAEEAYVAKVEAENGTMLGAAAVTADGTAVSGLQNDGDGVEVIISVPEAGHYDVIVHQSSVDGGQKTNYVSVNGERVSEVVCPGGQWNDGVARNIWLAEGDNTLSVTKSWGWISVDYIALRKSESLPADFFDVQPTLVNPNATEEARRLMTFLCDSYGKKMISGQQCQEGPFGLEIAGVWRGIGSKDYPAVLGMDLLSYSPARVEKEGNPSKVTDYAIEYWEKGGITTLCWHWCPDASYDNGNDIWGTFYTKNTNFNLAKVLSGEDEQGYQYLLRDIDAIAAELGKMQDAGVPILWRPLHEASGGWFWWGASGADAYLELYKLLYDRLTNVHGLNNLIWVWNGQDAAWYPGDEYVDIIGEDIYPGEHVYASQIDRFLKAASYSSTRKIITLSENGCIPDPDQCIRDGAMWSWWCTWSGDFVLKSAGFNAYSERYTEKSMLQAAYQHENVITRKTLPDLKNYPLRDQ